MLITNQYPVYIVSKGRPETIITYRYFINNNVNFKVVCEPQEAEAYAKTVGKDNILVTDFQDLGVGSYPARNFAWQDSIKNGYKKHWVFDDNIYGMGMWVKGIRANCPSNKAISFMEHFSNRYSNLGIIAFNYSNFVIPGSAKKPFYLNKHCYSGMLINNQLPFRWRLKYNEDVDLSINSIVNGYPTILMNSFFINKVSTTAKMKGGNQTSLYKNNNDSKKQLKAKSLEQVWPAIVKTIVRFGRPHHHVNWYAVKHKAILKMSDDYLAETDKLKQITFNVDLSNVKSKIVIKAFESYSESNYNINIK